MSFDRPWEIPPAIEEFTDPELEDLEIEDTEIRHPDCLDCRYAAETSPITNGLITCEIGVEVSKVPSSVVDKRQTTFYDIGTLKQFGLTFTGGYEPDNRNWIKWPLHYDPIWFGGECNSYLSKTDIKEYRVVCMDDIREVLRRGKYSFDPTDTPAAVDMMLAGVPSLLRQKKSVILDGINIMVNHRRSHLEFAWAANAVTVCIFMDIPVNVCIERDSKREYPVGEEIIREMEEAIEIPSASEFDRIIVVTKDSPTVAEIREQITEDGLLKVVLFCGLPGCGKTTLINRILRGDV